MTTIPTSEHIKQLELSLLDAFDYATLMDFTRKQSGFNLDWVTSAEERELTTIVSDLVIYCANQENGLKQLLDAALAIYPDSTNLNRLAKDWLNLFFLSIDLPANHPAMMAGHTTVVDTHIEGNVQAGGDFVGRDNIVMGDKITIGDIKDSMFAIGRGAFINVFPDQLAKKADTNRQRILAELQKIWIADILQASLYEGKELQTTFAPKERLVRGNRMEERMFLPTKPSDSDKIIPSTRFVEFFNTLEGAYKRSLLILGGPGSGKTTLMLLLMRYALEQAHQDPAQPIPIIFQLASWSKERLPLGKWLVMELNDVYAVPAKLGEQWIKEDALLLLLDGLDEVDPRYRGSCVEAINRFIDISEMEAIVCCRSHEYNQLDQKLNFLKAIEVQSLHNDDLQSYLNLIEPSKTIYLKDLLQKHAEVRELAKSPLMLNTMLQVYEGQAADTESPNIGGPNYEEELFSAYVDKRLAPIAKSRSDYLDDQTKYWLTWLAQQMKKQKQTLFLIEKLQPVWLPSKLVRWNYLLLSRMSISIFAGIVGGLLLGIGFGVFGSRWVEGIQRGLAEGVFACTIAGLTILLFDMVRIEALDEWWQTRWKNRTVYTFISISSITISIALAVWLGMGTLFGATEFLGFSWYFWFDRESKFVGILVGLCFGLIFGYGSKDIKQTLHDDVLAKEEMQWSKFDAFIGAAYGLISGIITVFVLNLTGAQGTPLYQMFPGNSFLYLSAITLMVFGILLGGFTNKTEIDTTQPNQGIKRAWKNMLFIGGTIGVIFGVIGILISLLTNGDWQSVVTMGFYGIFFGLIGVIWYGGLDVLKHGWLRLFLTRQGYMPKDYAHFLDYASERVLLRKVGGGYMFFHRLLLEHFAARKAVDTVGKG